MRVLLYQIQPVAGVDPPSQWSSTFPLRGVGVNRAERASLN